MAMALANPALCALQDASPLFSGQVLGSDDREGYCSLGPLFSRYAGGTAGEEEVCT